MQILYYHGGPGLNSNPERSILMMTLQEQGLDVRFWNEPSRLRDDRWREENAFENYLQSAAEFLEENYLNEPLVLIGHSFGAHPVRFLSVKYADRIQACVFISAALAVRNADVNMFRFILADYKKQGDDRWLAMQEVLDAYSGAFDENTEKGFRLLLENERLFDYYWSDKEEMQRFLGYLAGPQYSIDIEGFFAVRRSWREVKLEKSGIPAVAMFGRHDIVVSDHAEIDILRKNYSNLSVMHFEKSAHYPHLEEKDSFLRLLRKEVLQKIPFRSKSGGE